MKKAADQDEEREMRNDERDFLYKPPVCGNQHARKKQQVMPNDTALSARVLVKPVSKGDMA